MAVKVYKMYYTFCDRPGCGAINDYADTMPAARENARRHKVACDRESAIERAERMRMPIPDGAGGVEAAPSRRERQP